MRRRVLLAKGGLRGPSTWLGAGPLPSRALEIRDLLGRRVHRAFPICPDVITEVPTEPGRVRRFETELDLVHLRSETGAPDGTPLGQHHRLEHVACPPATGRLDRLSSRCNRHGDPCTPRRSSTHFWSDAHLAAFAMAAGARLVTFDGGFRRLEGLATVVLT